MKAIIKRYSARLALLLVAAALLTATVWAGSPEEPFNWSFGSAATVNRSQGKKTDAGETTGNYASVDVDSFYGTCRVNFSVWTLNGVQVTDSKLVTGATSFRLYYEEAVTNGYLYLYGVNSSGNGGMSGSWYP